MVLRTCAAHAVSDHALSAARLRIEQSTLHRRMRFSVLERLDALPMVDLCRVHTPHSKGQRLDSGQDGGAVMAAPGGIAASVDACSFADSSSSA